MPLDKAIIPELLLQSLTRLGFHEPTPVQAASLAAVESGKDVVALAPTGSGKTLAFGTGLIARLLRDRPKARRVENDGRGRHGKSGTHNKRRVETRIHAEDRLRAIVLCPTRELAQQVAADLAQAARGSVIKCGAVYGKSAIEPQRQLVASGLDIVVGTPGRLLELMNEGSLPTQAVLSVVVDEADRMVDMGFFPQVTKVLERIPATRQTLCFSATLPAHVEASIASIVREPVRVEVGKRNSAVAGDHKCYLIEDERKVALLLHLVKRRSLSGVVVYVRTRRRVGWVAQALRRNGISMEVMHGDRSQARRNEAISRFATGESNILVATDVVARGLHVPAIKIVVNYDAPMMPEDFVHRVGRSGHGEGRSSSISFIGAADSKRMRAAEELAGVKIEVTEVPDCSEFERQTSTPIPDQDTQRRHPKNKGGRRSQLDRAKVLPRATSRATGHHNRSEAAQAEPPQRKSKRRSRVDRSSPVGSKDGLGQQRGKQRNKPLSGQRPGGGVRPKPTS